MTTNEMARAVFCKQTICLLYNAISSEHPNELNE